MKLTRTFNAIIVIGVLLFNTVISGQILEVKQGKSALIKDAPNGNANHLRRLDVGTQVVKLGEVPRYYSVQLADGATGFSYKGNFKEVEGNLSVTNTKESLWAHTDVLKIIVLDVEVGDATLIICPLVDGAQDIILIDTGENDGDRIKEELKNNGFSLANQPITRFYNSHYDHDHMGDIKSIAHLIQVAYDVGDNDMSGKYKKAFKNVDRREVMLDYEESFTGGVTVKCVAVNQATDFDPNIAPSNDKNTNSMALIISYNGFDYFTAGDLTFEPEKSLAKGIQNCDAYHVNHHGSKTTSSNLDFIMKLDPEISIASNGHRHGHPSASVAERLLDSGSKFYQTNINPDSRAHQAPVKYLGDATFHSRKKNEDKEGATGSIRIVVNQNSYFVLMPRLPLDEATFLIEK